MPPVSHFSAREYGAESQNWHCADDASATYFFANNSGMLVYDGYSWSCTPIDGNSVVRSLEVEGDRIYAGAFEEFGYFSKNEYGKYSYTSLSKNLRNHTFKHDEIWNIARCGKVLFFQSFNSIFYYDGQKVGVMPLPDNLRPLYMFSVGGNLYVQMVDSDVYEYVVGGSEYSKHAGKWKKLISRSEVGNDNVVAINVMSGVEGIILTTEKSGIYRYTFGHLYRFNTEADNQLTSATVNRVTTTRNGLLWVGTLKSGVYAIDKNGSLKLHYDSYFGLPNNSVLGIHTDNYDNVWLALDDGIAVILNGLPISQLYLKPTEPHLGMVYGCGRFGSGIGIASNQGLYTFDEATGTLGELDGLKGQSWHIATYDGTTFIANNHATFLYRNGSQLERYPDNSTQTVKGRINGEEVLVQSSYHSLRVWHRDNDGKWSIIETVKGFGAPVRQVAIDGKGNIWCAHFNRGVFKVRLTGDPENPEITYYKTLGNTNGIQVFSVMDIHGTTLFSDGDLLYRYDDSRNAFVAGHQLNTDLPFIKEICNITPVNDNLMWLATKRAYHLVEYRDGHFRANLSISIDIFPKDNNDKNGSVFVDSNGISYLALNGTIAKVKIADFENKTLPKPRFYLSGVESPMSDSPLPYVIDDGGNAIDLQTTSVSFRFAYPQLLSSTPKYQFRLIHNGDTIKTMKNEPTITYHNLASGNYKLIAYAEDDNFGISDTVSYHFNVPLPYYLRWWAIFFYVLVVGAIVWYLSQIKVRRRLMREREEYREQEAARQKQMMEQERIIAEQKARLLENELSSKGKELASLAMNVNSKQQVIDNLRDSLADCRRTGGRDSRLASEMLRKIESSETDSREFWTVYEQNFDLIHEHFFRNLKQSFPNLTPIDMKFCALLRLNLSTKEIANFTHLTVRGVEAARYRLRKKLGITDGGSLVEFLIAFQPDESPLPQ